LECLQNFENYMLKTKEIVLQYIWLVSHGKIRIILLTLLTLYPSGPSGNNPGDLLPDIFWINHFKYLLLLLFSIFYSKWQTIFT